ncbi:MAG TPA: GNAT family N-acetyltransferase [Rhizomicrobium sp.]|nr:GNAT family N-acetyltransferase [Rhizomicrobium sp.]
MIRAATIGDLETLSRLHGACFAESWSAESFGKLLATPGAFALLAEPGGTADGFVLARMAHDEAEILSIGVAPHARRRGLAYELAQASAEHAATLGARTMFLEVAVTNAAAGALYAGLGFAEVGRRKAYYKDAGDALTLKAALPLTLHVGKRAGLD